MRLTLVSAGAFLGLASLLFLLYVRPFEMMLLGLFAYIVAYIIWSLDIMRSMRRFSAGEKKYAGREECSCYIQCHPQSFSLGYSHLTLSFAFATSQVFSTILPNPDPGSS
eukprot:635135-Amorphochlora_amoeboformis.AAC.3